MNWRTGVRVGVAVVGLGVATAVFIQSRNGPPPPALPADPPKLDPNVSLVGGATKIVQYKGGQPSVEVTASAQTNYTDGRARWENAIIHGLGDRTFTLHGAVVETRGPAVSGENPVQLEITKRLKFEASDGLVVESDNGSYDDATGVMTMPGAVTYRRGRLSGTAIGATYERETDTIRLLDAAKADVAADATGKGAAQASARRMIILRGQHSLQMEDGARIVGDVQVLSARNATLGFSEDESVMKFLELVGDARVAPGAGAAAGQPSLEADKITMSFQPDGVTMQHATLTGRAVMTTTSAASTRTIRASWIDLFTGSDGRTLTALKARDKVIVDIPATADRGGRAISAATLDATGDDKRGLTSARFEGAPCFQEDTAPAARGRAAFAADPAACTPAARAAARAGAGGTRRVGTATAIVLRLGGSLDAIEQADFLQNVLFDSGRASATGYSGLYDEKRGTLLLRPDPREPKRQPGVVTGDMTVSANEIDLQLETENLAARGVVGTRTAKKPATGQAAGALFGGDEPVFGTADALDYVRASGKAIYTGGARTPARLTQGATVISAARLDFTESTSNLVATGQVDSQIVMTGPAADPKAQARPQKYRVHADTFTYDDAKRTAVYEAPVVVLTTEDGNRTEARKLTFELAKEARTLERMRAEGAGGGVLATVSGGYEVRGDLLVYRADTDVYTVTGRPAMAKSAERGGRCELTVGTRLEMNRQTGSFEVPGSPGGSSTAPIACSESLRTIRK